MIGVAWLGISFCSLRDRCKEHPIQQQLPHQPAGPATSLKFCPLEKIFTQQVRARFNSNHTNSNTIHSQSCSSLNHKNKYLGNQMPPTFFVPALAQENNQSVKETSCLPEMLTVLHVSPLLLSPSQVPLGLSPLGWLMAQQGLQIYVLQLVKHGSKTSSNLQPSIYANINPVLIHRDQSNHTLRKTEHFETLVTGSTPPSLNHLQWSWPHLSSQLKLNLLSHYFS